MEIYIIAVLMLLLSVKTFATPCEEHYSVLLESSDAFDNGTLIDKVQGLLYPPGTYFNTSGIYRGCPCKIKTRPCLRKCCPIGRVFDSDRKCVTHEEIFKVNVTADDSESMFLVDGVKHFALIISKYCRSGRSFLLDPQTYFEDTFFIRASDGILTTPKFSDDKHGADDFCLEYSTKIGENVVVMCSPEDFHEQTESRRITGIVYPIFMVISIPPLFLTFLVYALIPELRNLHGKCLICYVLSLMFSYIFLSIAHLGQDTLPRSFCISTAFSTQFAFLGVFFWLNIMCIDICLTYCSRKQLSDSLNQSERRRFIIYSVYAWGCPSIIVIISLIMDFAPGIPEEYLKPRFGRSRCWFDRKIEALVYFYAPFSVLITCNIIMYVVTAVKVYQLKKRIQEMKEENTRPRMEKENRIRFKLYLKLLFIMGIVWVTEVLSWAIGGPDHYWYLADCVNCLQGVLIFIIFVCQKRVRKIVLRKICPNVVEKQSLGCSFFDKCCMVHYWSPKKASETGDTSSSTFISPPKDNIRMKPMEESSPKINDESDNLVP